jgi:hypothetical protein
VKANPTKYFTEGDESVKQNNAWWVSCLKISPLNCLD